jgi:hypothetical protein
MVTRSESRPTHAPDLAGPSPSSLKTGTSAGAYLMATKVSDISAPYAGAGRVVVPTSAQQPAAHLGRLASVWFDLGRRRATSLLAHRAGLAIAIEK